jgi:Tfp pilus assembly protein FimT
MAVGIAFLVMAVAVPSFLSWLPTVRLSSAARQVATDLQVARMKAIAQNISLTVSFNTSNGTYSYSSDSRDIGQEYPGISIASVSPSNPAFNSRGTASASVTITLSNGTAQKLVCVKTVGRVSIADTSCA